MSTEATGDGQTDAAGAVGADAAAGNRDPQVTPATEPEAVAPETAGPTGTAGPEGNAGPEGSEPEGSEPEGDAAEPGGDGGEAADEYDDYAQDDNPGYDDDYADDDAPEYDEGYEEYEEYEPAPEDDGEPDDLPAPRRARRWPRVLLGFGFVVLAGAIVGGAVVIVGSVTHGFKKPVKVTYTKSALFSLKTGQCFDPQGQSYTLISCDSPHVAEVFATFRLSGSTWPGDTAVASEASSGCATRLTGYLNPQLAISLSQAYVYPDSVAWQAGTRTVICEVRAASGDLTGSVQGADASAG